MNTRFAEARASFLRSSNPAPATVAAERAAQDATATRHLHRERDFGVGYGNSSGYGRDRHYTSNGFAPLFRCA
jgi:hypothetical protein